MLQWTAPWMLAGAGLVALPLIAHWLNRYSRRTYVFPTVQFLMSATAAENRWLKLRRLLLLLLRCLVVLAVAAAFARPIWYAEGVAVDQDQKVCVAIVIDNSLSTAQVSDGVSAQQRIRAAANEVLDSLVIGRDEAMVIVAESQPRPLFRRFSPNILELKRGVSELAGSQSRADLEAAIQVAASQLSDQPYSVRRSLVVISDLQQTNWQNANRPVGDGLKLPAGCEFRVMDLNLAPVSNVALSRPQALPRDPLPGQTCQLSARVTNFGSETRQVPVALWVGGQEVQSQTVQVESNQSIQASFAYVFSPDLGRDIEFHIPPDSLVADNRTFLYLQPGRQIPVGLISDDLINQHGSSAYFLERALRPFANEADRFDVQQLPSTQIDAQTLGRFQVLVVGYVRDWKENDAREIVQFVENGGRLLYFCGEGRVGQSLEQLEQVAGKPLFPFQVGRLERWRQVEEMLTIQSGQWRGRWLREFDLASQFALQQVRFPSAWTVTSVQGDSEVILSFSEQRPALALRSYGAGLVLQCNFSPSIEAGEFGKYAAFAALVQIVVRQLLDESDADTTHVVGQPLLFRSLVANNSVSRVHVLTPLDQRQSAQTTAAQTTAAQTTAAQTTAAQTTAAQSATEANVAFSDVSQAGFYTLFVDEKPVEVQAVNIDPRESDLRKVAAKTAAESFSSSAGPRSGTGVVTATQPLIDEGYSLWGWVLIFGLMALTVESFLLGYWRR